MATLAYAHTAATYPMPDLTPPPWTDQAACVGKWDMFFPEPGQKGATARARAICLTCPVIAPCREAGKTERHGVWGATSPDQRTRRRR